MTRNRGAFAVKRDSLRALWSEVVRTRDRFTCRRCGRSRAEGLQIDAAHILGAGAYPSLKYLSANGIALCTMHCHRWFDTHKSSERTGEADEWVRGEIGVDAYLKLLVTAKTTRKVDRVMAKLVLREERNQLRARAARA